MNSMVHVYQRMVEHKFFHAGILLDADMLNIFADIYLEVYPEHGGPMGLMAPFFSAVHFCADAFSKFDTIPGAAGKTGLYYEPRLSSGIDTEGVQKALNQRAKEADNKARTVQKKAEKKAKDIALKAEEKKKKEARLAQKKMDHDALQASLRRVRHNAEPKPKKKYVHTGIGKKNKAIASANSK